MSGTKRLTVENVYLSLLSLVVFYEDIVWSTVYRCSIGFRSGEFGFQHLEMFSHAPQIILEQFFAVWQSTLSCWKRPGLIGKVLIKRGCTWSATMFTQVVRVKVTAAEHCPEHQTAFPLSSGQHVYSDPSVGINFLSRMRAACIHASNTTNAKSLSYSKTNIKHHAELYIYGI